jgi:hypothetical protein
MSIIRNSVNEEPGDDAQRTLDPNHAQGLALHTLVGLIQTQILKDREVGIDTLRAKNLQKHIKKRRPDQKGRPDARGRKSIKKTAISNP